MSQEGQTVCQVIGIVGKRVKNSISLWPETCHKKVRLYAGSWYHRLLCCSFFTQCPLGVSFAMQFVEVDVLHFHCKISHLTNNSYQYMKSWTTSSELSAKD